MSPAPFPLARCFSRARSWHGGASIRACWQAVPGVSRSRPWCRRGVCMRRGADHGTDREGGTRPSAAHPLGPSHASAHGARMPARFGFSGSRDGAKCGSGSTWPLRRKIPARDREHPGKVEAPAVVGKLPGPLASYQPRFDRTHAGILPFFAVRQSAWQPVSNTNAGVQPQGLKTGAKAPASSGYTLNL